MQHNYLHELQMYNRCRDFIDASDGSLTKVHQLVTAAFRHHTLFHHELYRYQIEYVLEEIQGRFPTVKGVYEMKTVFGCFRDLAILVGSQKIHARAKANPHISDKSFSFCDYFNAVAENTLQYTLLYHLLSELSQGWTSSAIEKFKSNRCTYILTGDFPPHTTSIYDGWDYMDYLLSFFNGISVGEKDLCHFIETGRALHASNCLKQLKTIQDIDRDVNFLYVCLLPLLDNHGLISVEKGHFDILYQSFRCMYFIAGQLNRFYSILSKYSVNLYQKYVHLKNVSILDHLVLETCHKVPVSVLYDVCHVYQYDNMWRNSTVFGELLENLLTERKPLGGREHFFSLKLDLGSCAIPTSIMRCLSKTFKSICLSVTCDDVYNIISCLVCGLPSEPKRNIEKCVGVFYEYVYAFKRALQLKSFTDKQNTINDDLFFNSLFESAQELSVDFLRYLDSAEASHYALTHLSDKTQNHMITFEKDGFVFQRTVTSDSSLANMLLLGLSANALYEGLSPHLMQYYVRNIPSINCSSHWCDKFIFYQVQQTHSGDKVNQGHKILQNILAQKFHLEWVPVILGLLWGLCKLNCGDKAPQHKQWSEHFCLLVKETFAEEEKCHDKKSSLHDYFSIENEAQVSCVRHLLRVEYLFMAYGKKKNFTPLLRAACLYYGGVTMLQKIGKCFLNISGKMFTKSSKDTKSGCVELFNSFNPVSDDLICVRNIILQMFHCDLPFSHGGGQIIKKWDFIFPFLLHVKKAELYTNLITGCCVEWMM